MKRRLGLLGFALALLVLWGGNVSARPATRPNIVFILVDDLRWDALSCMGHSFAKTPHIDRLAKEGALFKNFFVTTPLCSPSRGSFLTGQYARTHGIIDNAARVELSHQLVTFPRLLREAGYESAYVGKWHMGNDYSRRPGFDYWVCLPGQGNYENPAINTNGQKTKVEGYVTDILNEHAVKFIRQPRSQPFVLYLSHKAVHGPFRPADRHQNLYADDTLLNVPSLADDLAGKPALRQGNSQLPESARKKKAQAPAGGMEKTRSMNLVRAQLRCLASIDEGVGQILQTLEATGQLDNTMVIFTSDNGYFWGEHGLGDKRWAYEESIRDPLLMRYPKLIKPGVTFEQMVMNIDIAPTLLELGGAPIPKNVEGRSLLPLLKNKKSSGREAVFLEYFQEQNFSRTPTWQAVRTEDWKLIHYPDLAGMDELYHLKKDRYEMKNLMGEASAKKKLAELQAQLKTFGKK